MTQEALKLAIDALEATSPLGFGTASDKRHYEAITAIKEALAQRTEQNFCSRCGKRTKDIHTCTLPQEKNS